MCTKYQSQKLVNGSLQIDTVLINRNWPWIDPQVKTNMEADIYSFSALNWLRNAINDLANHVIL